MENVTIIDVRTVSEFYGGSVTGAINIPLSEIQDRIDEIKAIKTPVILCCASGNRSGQATAYLQSQGVKNCSNGGSWLDVNRINQKG
jgi:rhodanese-related sulfurtransferase